MYSVVEHGSHLHHSNYQRVISSHAKRRGAEKAAHSWLKRRLVQKKKELLKRQDSWDIKRNCSFVLFQHTLNTRKATIPDDVCIIFSGRIHLGLPYRLKNNFSSRYFDLNLYTANVYITHPDVKTRGAEKGTLKYLVDSKAKRSPYSIMTYGR